MHGQAFPDTFINFTFGTGILDFFFKGLDLIAIFVLKTHEKILVEIIPWDHGNYLVSQ